MSTFICSASGDQSEPTDRGRTCQDAGQDLVDMGLPSFSLSMVVSDTETAYLIKGKVVVTPDDKALDAVTLMPGDLAVFPQGLACIWDVKEELDKHYKFD